EAIIEHAEFKLQTRQVGIEDQQPLEGADGALEIADLYRRLGVGQRLVGVAGIVLHGVEGRVISGLVRRVGGTGSVRAAQDGTEQQDRAKPGAAPKAGSIEW